MDFAALRTGLDEIVVAPDLAQRKRNARAAFRTGDNEVDGSCHFRTLVALPVDFAGRQPWLQAPNHSLMVALPGGNASWPTLQLT